MILTCVIHWLYSECTGSVFSNRKEKVVKEMPV